MARSLIERSSDQWVWALEHGTTREGRFETSSRYEDLPDSRDEAPTTARVAAWLEALRSLDEESVVRAMLALGTHQIHSAIPTIEERLRGSSGRQTRLAAAIALGRMGEASAVPELIDALSDKESLVRTAALEALRQLTGHDVPRPSPEKRPDDVPLEASDEWSDAQQRAGWFEWLASNGSKAAASQGTGGR
jgi:HEAT repeat protein